MANEPVGRTWTNFNIDPYYCTLVKLGCNVVSYGSQDCVDDVCLTLRAFEDDVNLSNDRDARNERGVIY
jgi:hypothetical protein